MPYLKLFRDEPEAPAPKPLPFDPSSRAGRSAGMTTTTDQGEAPMDSIAQVEEALSRVESNFKDLSEQVDEICEPIQMSDWLDSDDGGPWAA